MLFEESSEERCCFKHLVKDHAVSRIFWRITIFQGSFKERYYSKYLLKNYSILSINWRSIYSMYLITNHVSVILSLPDICEKIVQDSMSYRNIVITWTFNTFSLLCNNFLCFLNHSIPNIIWRTMLFQDSAKGACYFKNILKNYTIPSIFWRNMRFQASFEEPCYFKDLLKNDVIPIIFWRVMLFLASTEGACYLKQILKNYTITYMFWRIKFLLLLVSSSFLRRLSRILLLSNFLYKSQVQKLAH